MAQGSRRYSSSSLYTKMQDDTSENELRIVLIGRTGNGKSSTGNCIAGEEHFTVSPGMESETRTCQRLVVNRFGKSIQLVDTPGLFDTELTPNQILKEISKVIIMVSPGPHAFILVLRVNNRFTDEEKMAIEQLVEKFGETVYHYFIVLFTGKDLLGTWTEEFFIKRAPDSLKEILRKCGNRYLFFNNHGAVDEKEKQVKSLLHMIMQNTRGDHYTNRDFEKAEQIIKEKEKELIRREQEKNRREQEEIQREINQEIQKAKLEYERINENKIKRLEEEIQRLQESHYVRPAIREVVRREPNNTNLVDVIINTLGLIPRFVSFLAGKGDGCIIS